MEVAQTQDGPVRNHVLRGFWSRIWQRTPSQPIAIASYAVLQKKVYPELAEIEFESRPLHQRDIDELQLFLFSADWLVDQNQERNTKAILFRLHNTKLRMRLEHNHSRAHFHIDYKNQYHASCAVDTLEKLAGYVPTEFEKPILVWASHHQKSLKLTWDKLQAGENVQGLILESVSRSAGGSS